MTRLLQQVMQWAISRTCEGTWSWIQPLKNGTAGGKKPISNFPTALSPQFEEGPLVRGQK